MVSEHDLKRTFILKLSLRKRSIHISRSLCAFGKLAMHLKLKILTGVSLQRRECKPCLTYQAFSYGGRRPFGFTDIGTELYVVTR